VLIQLSRLGPAGLASGLDVDGLELTLQRGADLMKLPPQAVVVLSLTDDGRVREYNRHYRGLDEPTDVLAFAAQEKPRDQRFKAPPGTEYWLGDIVISLQRARVQAKEARHSIDDEVRLLAVHGFLHLLGYDHMDSQQERRMKQLTERILGSIE
jgi:probable rRNA maturation factor